MILFCVDRLNPSFAIANKYLQHFCVYFQCVGDDIEDLEYTPKPEFEGYFKVTNVRNEVMIHKSLYVCIDACI